MVLKFLSRGFSSALASPVRFGVGCLHQASSGVYWPGSAGVSLLRSTRFFGHFCHAVRVFPLSLRPSLPSLWCLGCMPHPFPSVASANRSNTTLNPAPCGRWTLRDKAAQRRLASRSAP